MADPRLAETLFRNTLARYSGLPLFHRKRSRTQQLPDDVLQITSGMLWGRLPRGGKCPTAQAYFGPLPPGVSGIEFVTPVHPQQTGLPAGFGANWYWSETAFTGALSVAGTEYAVIPVIVLRHQP